VALLGLSFLIAVQVRAANEAVLERLRKDITFLASDECEGRGVTTKGINLAADYIANEFKKAGLKPAGPDGSYFQPFTMRGTAKLENPNALTLRGPLGQEVRLRLNEDFRVLGLSGSGKVRAPVVFVGYGSTAKGVGPQDAGYDDFQGVDVAGKVVVVLRKAPRAGNSNTPFGGRMSAYHQALSTKVANAESHRAAAILFVSDRETAKESDNLTEFSYTAFESGSKLPAIHFRRAQADALLQSALGTPLRELEEDIDRDLKPRSAALTGWTASLEVNVARPLTAVKNVVGVLEGGGPLAKETVVVGAHYDHLGYGDFGSLAGRLKTPQIHHGADDNGSGTTAIIELARRFGQRPSELRRRLVFIAFSGEESGLLGSAHYCNHPLFPLADTAAMVNLDMVGRLTQDPQTGKDKLLVEGSGSAKTFEGLLETLNQKYEFKMTKQASGMGPSDHASFYRKKVPVLFYWTGTHKDYHRPSDTSDKINIPGMAKIVDLAEETIDHLAATRERPEYVSVPSPRGGGAPGMGPRVGIRPDYFDQEDGVLLDGVTEGTPAARAGLKENDRIIEVGGKPVKNLQNYMVLIRAYKSGDVIEFGVLRDGKKATVKVTLD
jgi:hypothetical protein